MAYNPITSLKKLRQAVLAGTVWEEPFSMFGSVAHRGRFVLRKRRGGDLCYAKVLNVDHDKGVATLHWVAEGFRGYAGKGEVPSRGANLRLWQQC